MLWNKHVEWMYRRGSIQMNFTMKLLYWDSYHCLQIFRGIVISGKRCFVSNSMCRSIIYHIDRWLKYYLGKVSKYTPSNDILNLYSLLFSNHSVYSETWRLLNKWFSEDTKQLIRANSPDENWNNNWNDCHSWWRAHWRISIKVCKF